MLSFICTVKDGARYLEECLGSVAAHYPNAEVVVVDDGSTDATPAILEAWAAGGARRTVLAPGGVGRGAALNLAVAACTRPFVANIDADDVALPGRDALVARLERSGPEVALVAGQSPAVAADAVAAASLAVAGGEGAVFEEVGPILYRCNPISHIGVVMRREAVLAVGGYDAARRSKLDYDLWVRLHRRGFRLYRSDRPVAVKRLHEGQLFERRDHLRYVLASAAVRVRAGRTPQEKAAAVAMTLPGVLWGALPWRLRRSATGWTALQELKRRVREGGEGRRQLRLLP